MPADEAGNTSYAQVPALVHGGPHPPASDGPGGRSSERPPGARPDHSADPGSRSEEHTSELQSHVNLVCRLLLEKKNNTTFSPILSMYVQALLDATSCLRP